MVQIRNVPESMHRQLKVRAAEEGVSLSEYLTQEIRRALARPTRRELLDRLASITREPVSPSAADILRRERDAR